MRRLRTAIRMLCCVVLVLATSCAGGEREDPHVAEGAQIDIRARDFSFTPSSFTADGGFTVVLRNSGRSEHYFIVEGVDEPGSVDALGAFSGDVEEKDYDLEPGTYTFFCSVSGHRVEGMEGTFVVGAA